MSGGGRRALSRLAGACLGAAVCLPLVAGTVAAAGTHFYVDGKHGSDTNAGTSLAAAFKTVKHALDLTKSAGSTIDVVGYSDYTYYETLSRPYQLPGTSTAPIVIEGYRPPSGTFVRPTISGALIVNQPGSSRWTQPDPTTYPGVWRTPWTTAIRGYDAANRPYRMERLFFDQENQLTRPKATSTLADLQAYPGSEYWDGTSLYVHLGRWDGAAIDTNPNHHQIVIPNYNGIVVNYLSSWVIVRDLQVIHASPGISFNQGSSHITVSNVDTSYDYPAGIVSQASDASFSYVTGRRNTMQLIKLQDGAVRTVIDHATARQNPAQGIKLTGAGTGPTTITNSQMIEGNAVPTWVATYSGEVQGIDIEEGAHDTTVKGTTISGMARGLVLYQVDSSGGPLKNTLVSGNSFVNNLHAVELWDGKSGGNSTGNAHFDHNTYENNGNAVFAPVTTTNKVFDHESINLTYAATGTGRAAILLQGTGTHVVFTNSIIARSPTYAVMAIDGATASLGYTDVWSYSKASSYGSVSWGSGIRHVDPAFLSTTPGATGYMVLPSGSSLLTASSTGGRIGAK